MEEFEASRPSDSNGSGMLAFLVKYIAAFGSAYPRFIEKKGGALWLVSEK